MTHSEKGLVRRCLVPPVSASDQGKLEADTKAVRDELVLGLKGGDPVIVASPGFSEW